MPSPRPWRPPPLHGGGGDEASPLSKSWERGSGGEGCTGRRTPPVVHTLLVAIGVWMDVIGSGGQVGMTVNGGIGEPVLLDEGLWQIDLGFQGTPEVIAAYLLAGNGELAVIETGPSTTLPALRAGIVAAGFAVSDLTAILVTHIHLDHSGAAGVLLDEAPNAQVFVHPIGAPHLIDPARLVSSAGRIYGDKMEPLWGEVRGIAAERVVALDDDQPVSVAGRVIAALHTPGHASHHLAFWDAAEGRAFTGDVGGSTSRGPPTSARRPRRRTWTQQDGGSSISRLQNLGASHLCLTHFGTVDDPAPTWRRCRRSWRSSCAWARRWSTGATTRRL